MDRLKQDPDLDPGFLKHWIRAFKNFRSRSDESNLRIRTTGWKYCETLFTENNEIALNAFFAPATCQQLIDINLLIWEAKKI